MQQCTITHLATDRPFSIFRTSGSASLITSLIMCDSSCLHCLHFALSEPYQPGGLFDRRLVTGLRFRLQSHRLVSCHTNVCVCMCAFGVKSVLLHIRHLKMPPMIIFPGIYMHDCLCQHTIYINIYVQCTLCTSVSTYILHICGPLEPYQSR